MDRRGVYVREAGAGDSVICIHASASSSAQWRPLIDRLAGRFRTLAVDLYGCGRSPEWPGDRPLTLADEVALLEPVVAATGRRFHLIGHSYGGAVALKVALAHPRWLASLVVSQTSSVRTSGTASPGYTGVQAGVRPRGGKNMAPYESRPATGFPTTSPAAGERVTAFLRQVYGWMAAGLAVTALVALAVAGSPAIVRAVLGNQILFFGLIIAELGLVFFLSARAQALAPATAAVLFALYSALNGATLAFVLLAYTGESVATTFVVTAGMFAALALFGSMTTRSLAGAGQFFFMGLIGLVLASLVGMFWHNDALQFLISVVGVLVFTGLTAWDAQRLRQMAVALPEGQTGSFAVVGALSLYLNFINLFLFMLRFLGSRRD